MPNMDGVEMTRQIRAMGAQLPIIVVTKQNPSFFPIVEKNALDVGADAVVDKAPALSAPSYNVTLQKALEDFLNPKAQFTPPDPSP
jgi:CheY-like chemotaxis protein